MPSCKRWLIVFVDRSANVIQCLLRKVMFSRKCFAGFCIAMLAGMFLSAGCDTQEEQDDFAEQASRSPENITRVDASGKILSEDKDDWRTAPVYVGEIRVDPAMPNPAPIGDFITIRVTVTVFDAVYSPLRLKNLHDNRLQTLSEIEQASDPGAYLFHVPVSLIGPVGLHRLLIFDGIGEIVSYGDVLVQ